ncbi:MAG: ctaB [Candidatus Saccharibacteria bacterium]|nr:ctaB [Candidatus Saccharibacteria bacterium]
MLTACAGFFLAAQGGVDFELLLATLAGTSLVIGSACVFNNYMDRDIDRLMARTKKRALVSGAISGKNALIFGTILGLLGVLILTIYTNLVTLYIGLLGFVAYVVLYGYYKRRSVHGTLVGTISGAVPPVAGYTAVTGRLDTAALILFAILVFWQMPHFYAIAMYRLKDYAAAGIPVLPVKKGMRITKIQVLLYIVGFTITSALLTVFGYASCGYLIVALLLGLSWFALGIRSFKAKDETLWGRKMFLRSLIVISLLCLTISIDSFVR